MAEEEMEIVIEEPSEKEGARVITFKASKKMLEEIEACMEKLGLEHRSELIRIALKYFITRRCRIR